MYLIKTADISIFLDEVGIILDDNSSRTKM